jgi:protease I
MKILIVSANGFEEAELLVPYYRLKEEGMTVQIASVSHGRIVGRHGYEIDTEHAIDDVHAEDYDALILPGGSAPAKLRENAAVRNLTRAFFAAHKPVGAICHGPKILISAGVLSGRRATCNEAVVAELHKAGVHYEDSEVVVDDNLVTSRQPADLPAFMRELMKKLRAHRSARHAASP